MRAILSVANREGLPDLARELQTHDVTMFATEETHQALQAEGLPAHSVNTLLPVGLGKDVETLHLALLAGLIARGAVARAREETGAQDIEPIDIMVVNLPSFARIAGQADIAVHEAMQHIDIDRITLLRAAARNFQDVVVLTRPEDYAPVLQEWREQGEVSLETRRRLALMAFQYTASYDAAIAEYLRVAEGELFPASLTLSLERLQVLRYGENPHQQAACYRWPDSPATQALPTVAGAQLVHGKAPTFNNLLDLDAALCSVRAFTAPTVAIVKHTNPCGLACGDTLVEAYKNAHTGDPVTAAGGVIGCNRALDEATAREISQLFYEAVIAPAFAPAALSILRQHPGTRLLATNCAIEPKTLNTQALHMVRPEIRSISGGLLLQTPDAAGERELEYSVVSEREPTLEEVTSLMFAWKAVRQVKSNAVVLAHKLMLIGIGAGQTSRVSSVQLAVEKAGARARGSVLASDAAFPFPDGIEAAAKAGVTAIIQPGGAKRDDEVIRMANHYAIALIFTGRRHYKH